MFQIISERFFMPLASPNKMIYWKTSIPFQMYQMDLNVLKKYESYGKKLTQNDRKRLCDMMESVDEDVKNLIIYMLEHDVKLEQECVKMKL